MVRNFVKYFIYFTNNKKNEISSNLQDCVFIQYRAKTAYMHRALTCTVLRMRTLQGYNAYSYRAKDAHLTKRHMAKNAYLHMAKNAYLRRIKNAYGTCAVTWITG